MKETNDNREREIGIDSPLRRIAPAVHPMGNLALPLPREEVLSNGIVLRSINGGTQEVHQLSLVFNGGSLEAATPAVARLCAALLSEGCSSFTGPELADFLDFHGAALKAEASDHFIHVVLTGVNSLCQGVMPVMRDILLSPTFPQDALDIFIEKEVQQRLLSEQKVSYLSNVAMVKLIMGDNNPAAQVEPLEEITAVNRAQLQEFHHKVFNSNGCQAFLSGCISDELYCQVKEMLESLPTTESPVEIKECPYVAEKPQEVFVAKEDAQQDSVRICFPAPRRSHPDYVPLRFTVMALGGYFGSRLMKNIREDKGYTYGIQAFLMGALDGSYVSIGAQADAAYVRPLLNETILELERLASEPMGNEELSRLKQYIASTLMETLDSPFAIMDFYKTMLVVGIPVGYFEHMVEVARNLSPALIMDMASKYLLPSQMRIAIAGK